MAARDLSTARRVFTKAEVPTAPEQIKTAPAPAALAVVEVAEPEPAPAPVPATAATPAGQKRLKKDGTPWGKTGPRPSSVAIRACNVSLPDDLWEALDAEVDARGDRRFNRSALIEEIVTAWKTKRKTKTAA